MDYGVTLNFEYIKFVLINKETFPDAKPYMVSYMDGTRITLLDDRDDELFIAFERLTVDVANIDTIAVQTYTIDLGGQSGRKVKFQTDEISPVGRRILVVESWAGVEEELDPGQ